MHSSRALKLDHLNRVHPSLVQFVAPVCSQSNRCGKKSLLTLSCYAFISFMSQGSISCILQSSVNIFICSSPAQVQNNQQEFNLQTYILHQHTCRDLILVPCPYFPLLCAPAVVRLFFCLSLLCLSCICVCGWSCQVLKAAFFFLLWNKFSRSVSLHEGPTVQLAHHIVY